MKEQFCAACSGAYLPCGLSWLVWTGFFIYDPAVDRDVPELDACRREECPAKAAAERAKALYTRSRDELRLRRFRFKMRRRVKVAKRLRVPVRLRIGARRPTVVRRALARARDRRVEAGLECPF